MSQQNSLGVYLPPTPAKTEFDIDGKLTEWTDEEHTIQAKQGDIDIEIQASSNIPEIKVLSSDFNPAKTTWTVVYWAREYGVPGAWKETLVLEHRRYRLGGLYRYAGFELKDREIDYKEHGETRCTPDEY